MWQEGRPFSGESEFTALNSKFEELSAVNCFTRCTPWSERWKTSRTFLRR